jgi:hypothetical protein
MSAASKSWLLCVALASSLGACGGQEGTIGITIVGAPNSDVLPQIQRIEATLLNPLRTFEGTRGSDNQLNLSIELRADGSSGDLVVEGFDSDDALIAVGRVGPLPLSAINEDIAVYMAAPMSLAEAPVQLDPPRSHLGTTIAVGGVLFVGGIGPEGPIADFDGYSTFLHATRSFLDMPSPVSDPAVISGSSGSVYILGGNDAAGLPRAESYAYDPKGFYQSLVVSDESARAGVGMTVVGTDLFVASGNPGLLVDGFSGTARPLLNGEGLDGPPITLFSDTNLQVLFAGSGVDDGGAIYEDGQIRRVGTPDELLLRDRHRGIALPTNEALYVGGSIAGVATTTAVLFKPLTGSFQTIELLATPRNNPAIAITGRHLLVVGGEADDGQPVGDVEIFDATTLDPIAVVPLQVPRKNTSAQPLRNGQVLIAGGQDASGAPTGVLELFTPEE